MGNTLVKSKKFNGKYVAIKDFDDNTIIGDGKSPAEAYTKAIRKGHKDPVVFFVPIKDMIQIY